MKNLKIFFVIIFGFLMFISCSKDDNGPKTTIQLYDKPLPEIKSYLEGKWQLHYAKGGLVANLVTHYDNSFWEFKFNEEDRIKTINGPFEVNTTITWIKYEDETWLMTFGGPYFVINGIYNDTLKIHVHAADGRYYYFTEY